MVTAPVPELLEERRIDPTAQIVGMVLGRESGHGDGHEVGITEPHRPVGEGELHGLDDPVSRAGVVRAHAAEIEAFEDVENLHQDGAAR